MKNIAKIIYFDCFAGVSGSMILGALIDGGLDPNLLKRELGKLNLKGWNLEIKKVMKGVIAGTLVEVIDNNQKQVYRYLKDIIELIDNSSLDTEIKGYSKEIFLAIARVESEVHNTTIEKVHFHEVGAVDSIIDIVGSVIGIKKLGIEEAYSSSLHVGKGFVECAHGTLPVPCPATARLLINLPIYSLGYEKELVTPTGAAIITTFVRKFGSIPSMKVEKIGYGAGSGDLKIPNLLRIFIGEKIKKREGYPSCERQNKK